MEPQARLSELFGHYGSVGLHQRAAFAGTVCSDNLFRLQPADGNLPSLEDGVSWPAIFDNYALDTIIGDLAYFRKKDRLIESSTFRRRGPIDAPNGCGRDLSERSRPVFAEIEIKPTMFGALSTALFKPTAHDRFGSALEGAVNGTICGRTKRRPGSSFLHSFTMSTSSAW